ncbi:MAG TPA: hypothetical protein VF380_03545, partial [Solirubrobacteraceae bacterium]
MSSTNGNSSAHVPAADNAAPPAAGVLVPVGGLPGASAPPSSSMAELRRRRHELAEQVAALTWDLGGLAYEMAIRDH